MTAHAQGGAPAEVLPGMVTFHCKTAESAEQGGVMGKIEESYKQIANLSARFEQESYFFGSDERRNSAGQVVFERPGKMDWQYQPPDEQRFTANGKNVWWYQPKQNQVLVRTLEQSFTSDVPVSFLLGVGKLQENFDFKSKCSTAAGLMVRLTPKKTSASLEEFFLVVDPKDFSPIGARIVDVAEKETSIVFADRKLNGGVEQKRFSFDIPKGTDIIDERDVAGEKGVAGKKEEGA